jgi:predicted nucleic acid-binding protein
VILVDTNVLLDLVTDDPHWADWSIAQLEAASLRGPLLVNDVVYAELAVRYGRIEELEVLKLFQYRVLRCSWRERSSRNTVNREDRAPAFCPLFHWRSSGG